QLVRHDPPEGRKFGQGPGGLSEGSGTCPRKAGWLALADLLPDRIRTKGGSGETARTRETEDCRTRESALCRAGRRPVAKDRRCPQTLRASPQGATWRDPHSPGRGRLPLAFGASGRRSRSISASDEVGNGIAGGPRVRSPHGH